MTTQSKMNLFVTEDINRKYCRIKLGEFDVLMHKKYQLFNVSNIFASVHKDYRDWSRVNRSKKFIQYLENKINTTSSDMTTPPLITHVVTDGPEEFRGTYVHLKIMIVAAASISPSHGYEVADIYEKFYLNKKEEERYALQIKLGHTKTLVDMLEDRFDRLETLIKPNVMNNNNGTDTCVL